MLRPQPGWRMLVRLTQTQLSRCTESRGVLTVEKRQLSVHNTYSHISSVANYSSLVQPRKSALEVKTLRPSRLASVGQSILNLSGRESHQVAFAKNHLQIKYRRTKDDHIVYPPDTEGVFYYNNAKSELRFRLCKNIESFEHGKDLVLPNGNIWCRSLDTMGRIPHKYAAPLALITDEFDIVSKDIDPIRDCHRLVSTFSPGRFSPMNQQLFDISGLARPQFFVGSLSKNSAHILYVARRNEGDPSSYYAVPFPPNTIGMLYYRQTQTCPTRLGELRFRLCSDVDTFHKGADLCLPSGDPWFISSQTLHFNDTTQPFHDLLVQEGLLERGLYPDLPKRKSGPKYKAPTLTGFGQPFTIDFSQSTTFLDLITLSPQMSSVRLKFCFTCRNRVDYGTSFSSGRAVVQLEKFPSSLLPARRPKPILALRVLEVVSPFKRSPGNVRILDPVPGELLLMRRILDNRVVPWSYGTSIKPDLRSALEEWIARTASLESETA